MTRIAIKHAVTTRAACGQGFGLQPGVGSVFGMPINLAKDGVDRVVRLDNARGKAQEMAQLTHSHSPLAQVRRRGRTTVASSRRPLSAREEKQLDRLLTEKYEYVDDELFTLPHEEAVKQVFTEPEDIPWPDTSWYHPVMDSLSDGRHNKSAQQVLLTAKQERIIFRQFNYCRKIVCDIRDELTQRSAMPPARVREMLIWFDKAERYRDQIAQINLALVLAMAKRTRMSEVDFADLISEGNMALLRAIDKFDVSRGFKFSTYACRAIIKAFSRSGMKLSKYRQMFPTDFDPALERSNYMETKRAEHEDDCVDEVRLIIRDNRAELSDIEQEVISHRFAINQPAATKDEPKPLTLEQVGKIIGVTKERVRQIQNRALDKIRHSLEHEYLK